jgi:two-component sensor histidine kinase
MQNVASIDVPKIMPKHAGRDLDRLAQIAATLCDTPMAFVAAFDDDTQWFKAQVGFDMTSTPRGNAICGAVYDAGTGVVIPDLLDDGRTSWNPVVQENGLRFYAGQPVRDGDGAIVGTVCILDVEPRPDGLTGAQAEGLEAIAEQVAAIFGLRRKATRSEALIIGHEQRAAHDRRRIARLSALVALGDQLRDVITPEEAFAVAAETLGVVLDSLQAGCAEVDDVARIAIIRHDWTRSGVPSSSGHHRYEDHVEVFEEMEAGRAMMVQAKLVNGDAVLSTLRVPVLAMGRLVGIAYAIDRPDRQWSDDDVQFARNVADRVHETIHRLRMQEDREVLVGEIGHRMKNLMAVTRAISMQTLTGRVDAAIIRDLDERLNAYSSAHDLLLAGGGKSAGLRETAETVCSRLSVEDRISFAGEEMMLNERATLSLSLLINELVTNAIKHGSLSVAEGRVVVDWRVEGDAIHMEWIETGGPPATAPTRRGFGSRILMLGLHRPGGTTLDYAPTGLSARFTAPLHEVAGGA